MATETRFLKVFCTPSEQRTIKKQYAAIETYEGFIVVEVSADQRDELVGKYPVEDITDQYQIKIGKRVIDTHQRIKRSGENKGYDAFADAAKLPRGKHHYLVQFIGPVKAAWITGLKRIKAEPREAIDAFSYVVRCDRETLKKVVKRPYVRWVGHLPHDDRVHIGAAAEEGGKGGLKGLYIIEFFSEHDRVAGKQAITKLGASIITMEPNTALMVVRLSGNIHDTIKKLSAVHGVRSIRKRVRKRKANNVAAKLMGTDATRSAPLDLTGKGEVIAICDTGVDTGRAENIHPDFVGRIKQIKSYPINPSYAPDEEINNPGHNDGGGDFSDGHGTHVAGSALGSGASSTRIPGHTTPLSGSAPGAQLYFQAVEQFVDWKDASNYISDGRYVMAGYPDDLKRLFRDARRAGAWIHSNSWGGWNLGEYDQESRYLDEFVWDNEHFCIVMAAGNEGTDRDCVGRIKRRTVNPPGTAKNCITVGASESRRLEFDHRTYGKRYPADFPCSPFHTKPLANSPNRVAAFSSRGPADGGRIKPDVVAPGTFILSTRSRLMELSDDGWAPFEADRHYFYMGGTSMATPLVSGAVALLREFLRVWINIPNPTAALIKASLIGGASKLDGYSDAADPCDNDQGYGLVNIDAIVAPESPAEAYFIDDTEGLRTGQVDRWRIKVKSGDAPLRIALAYTDSPGENLVNNLNLILADPDGVLYVGNGRGDEMLKPDAHNNTEVIHLAAPRNGNWELRVVASNVSVGRQHYALFLSGDIGDPDYVV